MEAKLLSLLLLLALALALAPPFVARAVATEGPEAQDFDVEGLERPETDIEEDRRERQNRELEAILHQLDSSDESQGEEDEEDEGQTGAGAASRGRRKSRLNAPGCGRFDGGRIIGGDEALPGSWPWHAAIMAKDKNGRWRPFCGGALITANHVLTAAHCLADRKSKQLRVRIGNREFADMQNVAPLKGDRMASWFAVHSKYEKNTHTHDIAIVGLKEAPRSSAQVPTVCLPISAQERFVGDEAVVIGHGRTDGADKKSASAKLLEASLQIFDNERCSRDFNNVISSQLCAGVEDNSRSSCKGDSGGALMVADGDRYLSVGIVSYGPKGCNTADKMHVYTRTSSYWNWIRKVTRKWT